MKALRSDLASLAACLNGSFESLARVPHGLEGDWEGLVRAASREFVLPALSHRLRQIGVQPPPEIAEFLATVEDWNGARNIRILEEMRAIASILNGVGIEPVALKGAAFLLAGIYPKPGCRYLCDLDLLVPHSDLRAAAEALELDGYRQDARDAMARFRHHYPQLQRPCTDGFGSAPVELHHSLGHGVSRKILSGEEMLRGSAVAEWNGVRIRVPSPEHLAPRTSSCIRRSTTVTASASGRRYERCTILRSWTGTSGRGSTGRMYNGASNPAASGLRCICTSSRSEKPWGYRCRSRSISDRSGARAGCGDKL
jgi:hypothetical protein